MSGMEKFWNALGFQVEYEDEEDADSEQTSHTEERYKRQLNRTETQTPKTTSQPVSKPAGGSNHVVLLEPSKISDAQKICDELKVGKTVVINTENLNNEDMTRVLDFASGATYALDGNMKEISDRVHVLAPFNVDIQTQEIKASYFEDETEEDEFEF